MPVSLDGYGVCQDLAQGIRRCRFVDAHPPFGMWPDPDHGPRTRSDDYSSSRFSPQGNWRHASAAVLRRVDKEAKWWGVPTRVIRSATCDHRLPTNARCTRNDAAHPPHRHGIQLAGAALSRFGRAVSARGRDPQKEVWGYTRGSVMLEHPLWWMSTSPGCRSKTGRRSANPSVILNRPGARVICFQRHRGIRW